VELADGQAAVDLGALAGGVGVLLDQITGEEPGEIGDAAEDFARKRSGWCSRLRARFRSSCACLAVTDAIRSFEIRSIAYVGR
jgi:hypothetical protein